MSGSLVGASPLAGAIPASSKATSPDISKAAGDFEALLISQMMRSMRESGSGSGRLGTGGDGSSDSLMEMAEQQFARVMVARGGLGLGKMVVQGLEARVAAAADKRE